MKKLVLTTLLVIGIGGLSAQAAGPRFHHGHGYIGHVGHYGHYGHYRSHGRSSVSFYFGPSPWYGSSWYGPSYYGPSVSYYSYSPGYGGYSAYGYGYPAYGYSYGESRPNYAVSGTLLGALTGGIIGNSIHHQGWEGAGIGAAAGLLLGSVAEHSARSHEPVYYSAPTVSYAQPAYSISDPPTVNKAPKASAAPKVQEHQTRTTTSRTPAHRQTRSSAMSSANKLFGR